MKNKKTKKTIVCAYNTTSDAGLDTSSFSVFVNGCNLKCPYCMNNLLISGDFIPSDNIYNNFLKDLKTLNPSMIFISGGEPTLHGLDLLKFIKEFKKKGFKIGLSTNGTNPDILNKCLPFLDYVALDLKGTKIAYFDLLFSYHELNDGNESFKDMTKNDKLYVNVLSSWISLKKRKKLNLGFDYEIRTTLYPVYVNIPEIEELSKLFTDEDKWVFQQYRPVCNMPLEEAKHTKPYTEKHIKKILKMANKNVKNVILRYV